ncbi:hypothetical protein ABEB36_011905 [Hypothenemus hampei]|uniref:Poly [ADP-ribose] polymerase n=1 Tax=Hypothenemus hampei TaxID=57062 RepID=A0ABD1E9H6_HYPHA
MNYQDVLRNLPMNWDPMSNSVRYENIPLSPSSFEYRCIKSQFYGNYYKQVISLQRVQNPLTYAKFRHKVDEYKSRGSAALLSLYHDTSIENVNSIAMHNFDWRTSITNKFGPGVYFSISPSLAARHSRKTTESPYRAMFLADVATLNVQQFDGESIFLPNYGYDTLLVHRKQTYVKYHDNEFYPNYFLIYEAH